LLLLLMLLLLLLQEGEAPEEVRAVLQQRSRWAKGHFQVFFSRHCPLFHLKLNMLHKVLYTNGKRTYTAVAALAACFSPG
jgi:cellulose synthase/poly-beta-1,6-N-acetylglucosamine synthase-like glycosyltransferase